MNFTSTTFDSLPFTHANCHFKDHPILGHPVFHIHPCNTATMMRNLLTGELDVKGHQYVCIAILMYFFEGQLACYMYTNFNFRFMSYHLMVILHKL